MSDVGSLTLPYRAEYAKSGRSSCRSCKSTIENQSLRIAVMVKSPHFDGMMPQWNHHSCFFKKYRPASVGAISHFESLRPKDQDLIRKQIGGGSGSESNGSEAASVPLEEFKIQHAASSRSGCVACSESIAKGEVRIGKEDKLSESAAAFGPIFRWHHIPCFIKVAADIGFTHDPNRIPGFKDLEKADRDKVLKALKALPKKRPANGTADAPAAKMAKSDTNPNEAKVKAQMNRCYKIRDKLSKAFEEKMLTKNDIYRLCQENHQQIPSGIQSAFDRLMDYMVFGPIKNCENCKQGQLVYRSGVGYQCLGYVSEFAKCNFVLDQPKRYSKFRIPEDLKDKCQFLSDFVFKPEIRVIPTHVEHKAASEGLQGFAQLVKNPLKGFEVAFMGPKPTKKAEKLVTGFGGTIVEDQPFFFLLTKGEKPGKMMVKGKENFPIFKISALDEPDLVKGKPIEKILLPYLAHGDFNEESIKAHFLSKDPNYGKEKPRGGENKEERRVKLKMKGGAVVDPDSGLDHDSHVYRDRNGRYYNVVLNRTSVEDGTNSYYKIQLIEADKKNEFYVFNAWGRIGTTRGGNKLEEYSDIEEAKDQFTEIFEKKTGNIFGKKYVFRPGGYMLMDIDYSGGDEVKIQNEKMPSTLATPLQALVQLIFDVKKMRETLIEFELDVNKLPLGKMTKKQLLGAYSVLSNAVKFMALDDEKLKKAKAIEISNKFYTIIPHDFGSHIPTILDKEELIKTKMEMIENLMEIEIAYELINQGEKDAKGKNLMDAKYETLKAEMSVIEKNSDDFSIIEKYLKNTHADTHDQYSLDIIDVFKVVRQGEGERFEKFKCLHNHKLLWHGSRTTNFAGILSQGLRIAPPEAPVTGYMFGKGIYFADMVSKSANYCNTSPTNSTGLLLLCEVALGDMAKMMTAKETLKKPPGHDHSVMGIGKTCPDPKGSDYLEFDSKKVQVPLGKPTQVRTDSHLLYNEYIVYDPAQVRVRYLVLVNFDYTKKKRRY